MLCKVVRFKQMEDQDQFRHGCKLCDRSFPCGRSLGGHMRSHLINNNSTETDDQKLTRVKFSSLSNYTHESGFDSGSQAGYGLRENPKKTWRIAGSSEDTDDKLCRECGKEFQTWKALLSHMKCCHSNSNTNSFDQNEHDSGISGNAVDSQSENETTNTRKRRTSGSRRKTRYLGTAATTTSSSNFSNVNNNASSSVTEIEQEQQEKVALCLMMLSRDVGHWGGLKYAAADDHDHSTSDNNSGFLDTPSSLRTTRVGKIETLNSKKLKNKMLQGEISGGEFSKKNLVVKKIEVADQAQLGSNKFNSNKRKLQHVYDHSPKRGKVFECGTCSKVFRSYQALGGHRASHKKIKGCFASKTESSENTNEFDTDSKLSDSIDHHHHHSNAVKKVESSITKSKGHSCPICLKVFPTGQALGGHKRSHLIGAQSSIVIPKPENPEVRDFLDLNLPAPVEEEAFNTWWVGSSHKHEALVS